jgi:hypothetical protein
VLQQVQDAIAGGGIAAGQTKARELMAVHYDPGSLSEAYLTASSRGAGGGGAPLAN